jgi:L-threonylcarbamoyladenylate synthase
VSPFDGCEAPGRVAVTRIARLVRAGGVVAYPTEGVFGLGCAADDPAPVIRILALKGRGAGQGFIVLGSDFAQIEALLAPLPRKLRARLDATWPGPMTWVVPAAADTPVWLTGGRDTLAVRITAHPPARALCDEAGVALVSTSANLHGRPPARTALAVRRTFGRTIDGILPGACGTLGGPTEIRELVSGRVLRPPPASQGRET